MSLLSAQTRQPKAIALWLFVCCALIFVMVVLGGVTRLTRSGLSMVEWDPIMGAVPPLTRSQWEATFDKYKQFPEYREINRGMSLGEFKSIFWMEYNHRLLGRAIGLAFLLPFLYFLMTKKIGRPLLPKLIMLFVLGAFQGLLGWYMVKSGLVDKPHVSQYRLTAHLVAAMAIYGFMFWVALGLLLPDSGHANDPGRKRLKRVGIIVTASICLLIISGGFVAGTKAGFAFNTFPLMNGRWVPEGIFAMQPALINLFENIATIQFNHRLLAGVLCLLIPAYWFLAQRTGTDSQTRIAFHLLLAMLAIQVGLGISTLLYVVPVALAAAHQAGALALLTVALFINYKLRATATHFDQSRIASSLAAG